MGSKKIEDRRNGNQRGMAHLAETGKPKPYHKGGTERGRAGKGTIFMTCIGERVGRGGVTWPILRTSPMSDNRELTQNPHREINAISS